MRRDINDSADAATLSLASELRVLIGKLKRRLREQANVGDLTPSQIAVLRHLDREGPMTVTALARAEGVRSQSMGATVATLEAAGFVGGSPHPTDGRQTILSLTAAFQEKLAAGRAVHDDWLFRAIRTTLAPNEQQDLARAIALLRRLADC
jgi:DNA-binding MarR family transcriptional regulator